MDPQRRRQLEELREALLALHDRIRGAVVESCEAQSTEALSRAVGDDAGDTIYAIDRVSEELLLDGLQEVAERAPLVLIAEGVSAEAMVLPRGTAERDARWRVLCDPIDGTRGLMVQKRPAWILTGVAPNRGAATSLRDIELAVQSEIPLVKQHLCDQLSCIRGEPVRGERINRLDGTRAPLSLRPSRADSIAHGFAMLSRFFPGARDVLAAIDDEVAERVLGPPVPDRARCFEDQYISSGGQLYELMAGHDRFIGDLRPLLRALSPVQHAGAPAIGACCHPYDVCTLLIAETLGVLVTGADGEPLDAPLDLHSNVAWLGYANATIRAQVEPALRAALGARQLI